MPTFLKRVLVVLALVGAVVAALKWPHLNDVETGRTPEYPDLKARTYDKAPADLSGLAQAAVARLRWTYVGAGSGPGGSEIKAVARPWHYVPPSEITIKIRREQGRSVVSVRSTSRDLPWDLGQNARFIRALQDEMDRQSP